MVNRTGFHTGFWVRAFLLAALVICTAEPVRADQSETKPLPLGALEQKVLSESSSLLALRQKLESLKETQNTIDNEFGPDLILNFNMFPKGAEIDEGDLNTKTQTRLRIKQDLLKPFFMKQDKLESSQAEIASMKAEMEDARAYAIYLLRLKYLEALEHQKSIEFMGHLETLSDDLLKLKIEKLQAKDILMPDVFQVEKDRITTLARRQTSQTQLKQTLDWIARLAKVNSSDIQIIELPPSPSYKKIEELTDVNMNSLPRVQAVNQRAKMEIAQSQHSILNEIDLSLAVGYQIRESQSGQVSSGIETRAIFQMPLAILGLAEHKKARHISNSNYWKYKAEESAFAIRDELADSLKNYSLLDGKINSLQKAIEEKLELHRIEKEKISSKAFSVNGDPGKALEFEMAVKKLALERKLAQYQQKGVYFKILYLTGQQDENQRTSKISLKRGSISDTHISKSLWIWRFNTLLKSGKDIRDLVSFCITKNIGRVYLSIDKNTARFLEIGEDPGGTKEKLSLLVRNFHKANIRVSALIGNSGWVLPQKRGRLLDRVRKIMAYNEKVCVNCQFDSLHLDIEPHLLEEWKSDPESFMDLYYETLVTVKGLLQTTRPPVSLEADIPVFYDRVSKKVFSRIVRVVDELTLMAYSRKNASKLLKDVKGELEETASAKKQVRVGINAKDFSSETEMERFLDEIGEILETFPSFSGFAVHDYENFQKLAKEKNY